MNKNLREEMKEYLREDEIKLLERVAEVLGEDIETIYCTSKNETIERLVEELEKAW